MEINIAKLTTDEIKKVKGIELPEIKEDYIEIQLEDVIKDYEEHKRKRNERVYKKFGVETDEQKRKRQQRELQEDLLSEMRY